MILYEGGDYIINLEFCSCIHFVENGQRANVVAVTVDGRTYVLKMADSHKKARDWKSVLARMIIAEAGSVIITQAAVDKRLAEGANNV